MLWEPLSLARPKPFNREGGKKRGPQTRAPGSSPRLPNHGTLCIVTSDSSFRTEGTRIIYGFVGNIQDYTPVKSPAACLAHSRGSLKSTWAPRRYIWKRLIWTGTRARSPVGGLGTVCRRESERGNCGQKEEEGGRAGGDIRGGARRAQRCPHRVGDAAAVSISCLQLRQCPCPSHFCLRPGTSAWAGRPHYHDHSCCTISC